MYGPFGNIALVEIQWDKLEIAGPFVFYGNYVGFAVLVFQDLEINGVAAALETRHDVVVHCMAVAVMP